MHVTLLTNDKHLQLSGFLGQLPETVAARLAKAVEVDRLIGGTDLPHEEILAALRPQLKATPAPQRTETPLRLFCRPFEDLLVASDRKIKQKGRIARSSIDPVQSWLDNELMPGRYAELIEALRAAIMQNSSAEIENVLTLVWRETSVALRQALSDEAQKIAASRMLGGIAVAEDAYDMALLLADAREVYELQKRLHKPVLALTEEHITFIRHTFDRLSDTNPDLAPYIPLVVMGRLERPWEALRLTGAVSRKIVDTVIANTDMGVVGELLFSDLDMYTNRIQTVRPLDFDSQQLLSNLAAFSELSSGIVKELGIRRDGKWGQRLGKDRSAVSAVMEGLLERAPKEILAGLPAVKVGAFSKGPKPLDIGRAPDPDRVARAMRYAHLMVHSRPFAVAAAFSAKLKEAWDETAGALRSYNEDILRELRAASPDKRVTVEQHFSNALAICKLVLGDDEADFLRRRSKVGL
jgi:hypothetical protein